jgi:large subunit ribosomal protein L1
MNKKAILDSIKKLREISKKRNFNQTFDLIINLKQVNLKNPEEKIDLFLNLPYPRGKKSKICALVDKELELKAKIFDEMILKQDFPIYARDKKKTKKLATKYDYFIAQANLMPDIASTFGKVFGPKGKMPNPKAGCVVPPIAELGPVKEKVSTLIRLLTKSQSIIKVAVGDESMKDEEIEENISTVHHLILDTLPRKEQNMGSTFIKLTMSASVQITEKGPVLQDKKDEKSKRIK